MAAAAAGDAAALELAALADAALAPLLLSFAFTFVVALVHVFSW